MESNTVIIRIDSGAIPAVFWLLFVAGFFYNLFTAWVLRRHYDEGYTALLVCGGVGMTLLGICLLNSEVSELMLFAFAASGFWMVIGSVWRHMRARERSQQAIKDEAARLAE
jgi:predicted permease